MRRALRSYCLLNAVLGSLLAVARAAPLPINVPAQPADAALLTLAGQANIEMLFSSSDLHQKKSTAVVGRFEPEDALARALRGTGFEAHATSPGKFAVTRSRQPTTVVRGQLLAPDGTGARGVQVTLPALHLTRATDAQGDFIFPEVAPGTYKLIASAPGVQTLQLAGLRATVDGPLIIPPHTLQVAGEPSKLAPFVVEATTYDPNGATSRPTIFPPRTAVGNLDLARTEHDAIPFTIYDREHIRRSGVVNLNEYLQREILDADASARPPEQSGGGAAYATGSSNLSLRGYDADETVIMVDGRRLPEILTSLDSTPTMPDVNFIPLSLVQEVEVLPISASALYNGNPVGGVINIMLRPGVDANSTELTATYNNAFGHFDAPQSSLSLLNSETLLGGALRLHFNVSTTRTIPATEAELGYHRRNTIVPTDLGASIYRATPNIHAVDFGHVSLFGPGTPAFTSVAPGADGNGGLAAFAGRAGIRNLDLFKSPGGLAASTDSSDYPYGRDQQRNVYFGSIVYDITPWLQLGLDATYASTIVHGGYDVLKGDLILAADSPLNPFQQEVKVSLNETARDLGQNYSEARIDFSSLVFGALVKLPREWHLSIDAQYAHNTTRYRGLYGADTDRWQTLVDTGAYNPLRDTQAFNAPKAFYDQVLVYRGAKDQFAKIGDYDALDAAFRATNEFLRLPTGLATINLGGDYRRNHLAAFREEYRYADGTLASRAPTDWAERTLQRYSIFGELRAKIVSARLLPSWIRGFETDLAVRYIGANSAKESYLAPTYSLKLEFTNGFSFRGSLTTSSRYPTPQLNVPVIPPPTGGVIPVYTEEVDDPRRGERYAVPVIQLYNPALLPETALTQSAGVMYQRGKIHRLRATLDFVDTHKTNEELFLGSATLVGLEALYPDRVIRGPVPAGDPHSVGPLTTIFTGTSNVAGRHSQNLSGSADYAWTECFGGTLEVYARLIYFELYQRQILPGSHPTDELAHPDPTASGLLRYRTNFGAGWSNRNFGFGWDGRYYSPRVLPQYQWLAQGHDRIRPAWQFDAYLESDIGRWLPWDQSRHGLRLQLRVNNVFGDRFPKYVDEPTGTGVQPYGDWRGRTYSLSLTANF